MIRAWIVPLVLQVATPMALLLWQATAHHRTLAGWAFATALVATYIAVAAVAGLWLEVPPTVCAALFAASALIAVRRYPWSRLGREPGSWLRVSLVRVSRVVALGLVLVVIATALLGRKLPQLATVDLEFPLRDGTYYIANGGSTRLINAHTALLGAAQFARYRGAGYGLDIVKLNDTGTHAMGLAPRDPARYVIFGEPIYAPCEGIVARSEDGLPDMSPPEVDRAHMPGNFVLLECGEAQVLVAHMRRDTVNVHPGDYVTLETKLGEVGNSGNSDAPHLHVHAQRAGQMWDIFNADPLPIRFNGRFLVRNDRVTAPPAESEPIDD